MESEKIASRLTLPRHFRSIATVLLAGTAPLLSISVANAQIQSSANETTEQSAADILVVGSRLRSGPPQTEAVPISVIGAAEIRKSGATSVQEILTKLPQAAGSATIDGQTDGAPTGSQSRSGINLKGLGERYTLVLVNGRRAAGDGPADLNLIPPSAIERIEILKSGASAIYGSDALAGVVNVVLKSRDKGFSIDVDYGHVDRGNLSTQNYSLSYGEQSESGRFFASINQYIRQPLDAIDRDVTKSNDQRLYGSSDFRSPNTVPANFQLNGQTLILNSDLFGPGTFSNNPENYRVYNASRDNYDRIPRSYDLIGGTQRTTGYVRAEQEIGAGENPITVFAEMLYTESNSKTDFGGSGMNIGVGTVICVPASNPYNPFGVAICNLRRRNDEAGPGGRLYNIKQYRASAGATGTITNGWGYSFDVNKFSRKEILTQKGDSTLQSVLGLNAALSRTGPNAFNPFCNACNTPAQLDGIFQAGSIYINSASTVLTGSVNGSLNFSEFADIPVAFGGEYRTIQSSSDADLGWKDGTRPGGARIVPQSFSRNSKAVFAEAKIPLLGNGIINEARLQISLAARYEEFSDFGKTFNPAIGAFYEVIPGTMLARGSYNRSFNAPFLAEVSGTLTETQTNIIDPRDQRSKIARLYSGGNPDLSAERGEAWTLGVVLKPKFIRGLTASIDLFNNTQSNVIVTPSVAAILLGTVTPARPFREGPNVDGFGSELIVYQNLANAGKREYQSLEAEITYASSIGDILISTQFNATQVLKFKVDTGVGTGFTSYRGVYDEQFGPHPAFRSSLTQIFSYNAVTVTARWNHISALNDAVPGGVPGTYRISAYDTADLNFRLALDKLMPGVVRGLELRVGADNVFNRSIPFVRANGDISDTTGLYDYRERFFYGGVSAKF